MVIVLGMGGVSGCNSDASKISLKYITITPEVTTLAVGSTQQLHLTGHYSQDYEKSLDSDILWIQNVSEIATVDENGLVTGKKAGTLTITAQVGRLSATALVHVTEYGNDFFSVRSGLRSAYTKYYVESVAPESNQRDFNIPRITAQFDEAGISIGYGSPALPGLRMRVEMPDTFNSQIGHIFYTPYYDFYIQGQGVGSYSGDDAQAIVTDKSVYAFQTYGNDKATITVNVTRWDPVGGLVQGTYQIIECSRITAVCSADNPDSRSVILNGDFSVTREANIGFENLGEQNKPQSYIEYNGNSKPFAQVGNGASFIKYKLPGPPAGPAEYRLSLSALSDKVVLQVYGDNYANELCGNNSLDINATYCDFTTGQEFVYIKVVYAGDGAGAKFQITASPTANNFPSEGSQTDPVTFDGLPVKHSGSVNSFGNSFYAVPVVATQTYTVSLNDISENAGLYVFDGRNVGALLCSSGIFTDGTNHHQCVVSPQSEELLILARGTDGFIGSTYTLRIIEGTYADEGDALNPVTAGVAPLSFEGQVRTSSYYSIGTTPGKKYRISLREANGQVTVAFPLQSPSPVNPILCPGHLTTLGFCVFESFAETVVLGVQSNNNTGAAFVVDVEEFHPAAEGSVSNPVTISDACGDTCIEPVHSVDTGSSYYVFANLLKPRRYLVTLGDSIGGGRFNVYSDAGFSQLLCASTESTTVNRPVQSCMTDAGFDAVYVRVDGSVTTNGDMYRLSVANPFANHGSEQSPEPMGSAPVENFFAEAGTQMSWYSLAVTANASYLVDASLLSGSETLPDFVVRDAGSTNNICLPKDKEIFPTNGVCRFIPAANSVLIGVPNIKGAGADYFLNIKPSATPYFIETIGSGAARYNSYEVVIYDQTPNRLYRVYSNNAGNYPAGWLMLESGKTYYFSVADFGNQGGAYTFRIGDKGFGLQEGAAAPDIDAAEPQDNASGGASVVIVNQATEHSFSFNGGDFGDVDWFTFTVP